MSSIHISSPSAFPVQFFQLSKASGPKFSRVSFKLTAAKPRPPILCLFGGGKGKSENGKNEGSPWKVLENAMGSFKKDQSIEDVLKQQIQKQEYYGDGDPPGKPPGGGRGGGDGFWEGEDEGFSEMWDEITQVVLATLGFIFVYIYILEGEEITVIAKDLLKFLLTRQKSIRLSRIIDDCTSFLERMKQKSEFDPYALEKEIINTPTWYDHPAKYEYIIRKLSSSSHPDSDQDDGDDSVRKLSSSARPDYDQDDGDDSIRNLSSSSRLDYDQDDGDDE